MRRGGRCAWWACWYRGKRTGTGDEARRFAARSEVWGVFGECNLEGQTDGVVVPFMTLKQAPTDTTEPASGVKATEARLEGIVNPNNQVTECKFEYGTEPSLAKGTIVPCEQASLEGYGEQGVGLNLTGLPQGTTYYYKLLAKNASGEEKVGGIQHFTTATPEAAVTSSPAAEIRATTATLEGVLNPNSPGVKGTYEFHYKKSATECEGEGEEPPTPSTEATGAKGQLLAKAQLTGLLPGTTYTFCVIVKNAAEEAAHGAPVTFTTLSVAPTIIPESESTTNVTSDSAVLDAEINPGGGETTYYFNTAPTAAYGSRTAEAGLNGADDNPRNASIPIQELQPATEYHFHVVAHNATGGGNGSTQEGADQTFRTQAAGSEFTLPDNRAWEMVSPVDKHGAVIGAIGVLQGEGGLIQAAENGSAITYVADAPPVSNPEGTLSYGESQIVSKRGSSGWASRDIATAHEQAYDEAPAGDLNEYLFFSPDLSRGLVEPSALVRGGHTTPLTPQDPEAEAYLREGLLEENGAHYTPLVNSAKASIGFMGASRNLKHVIFGDNTEGIEWNSGSTVPVFILPPGNKAEGFSTLGGSKSNVRNAVSNDGQKVFFSVGLHLFMRDVPEARTVQLDLPQGNPLPNEYLQGAEFQYATADGSKVYFKDDQRLTSDSTAERQVPELYEYNTLTGVLTDLTPDTESTTSTGVSGEIQVSENDEYIYFVANGSLGGAPEGAKLYVAHSENGKLATSLVAMLSGSDYWDWLNAGGNGLTVDVTSRVSPNGHYFAFMSERSLTGYNNTDAVSGARDEEVFVYDALTKHLACASCDPTGARPHGVFNGKGSNLLIEQDELWKGAWLAGSIPGWTIYSKRAADYQSRYLSNEGRLFFDSPDSLVAQDTNGEADVYEYQPEGRDCSDRSASASEVYEQGGGGESGACVGLISSGSSSTESAFLDASGRARPEGEEGEDVFFLTSAKLSAQDVDNANDIYDAHVCSVAAPCLNVPASSPACTTADSCRAAPGAQPSVFGAPSSASFSGAGNATSSTPRITVRSRVLTRAQKLAGALTKCRKSGVGRKRMACEKRARRRYGAVAKARKSIRGGK